MPLAVNLFGTQERMATALGVDSLDDVGDRIGAMLKPELPVGLSGLREALGKAARLTSMPPKRVKTAPCQDVVYKGTEVDLFRLPGVHAWPNDGGAFLNLGLTHTKHPETGQRNLGMYRLQRHDARTVGHALADPQGLQRPPRGGRAARRAAAGGHRVRLRPGGDLRRVGAAAGRDRRVPVRRLPARRAGRDGRLPHRAAAGPGQLRRSCWKAGWSRASGCRKGPFGDHTGFYTPVEPFPALTVDVMTMRQDPVFQTIVVGRPPQEDGPLGKATERIFLPLIKMIDPGDRRLRPARVVGVFHNCAIVSIDKRFPKHAQKVMNAIWGAGLLSLIEADRGRRRGL